jgi:hypothetical protein
MTPQNASGVPSCETELASCQAVLGAVGTKKAEDGVPLAAAAAETGTPSSASTGARLRCSPPPIRPACTDCVRIDARALRVCTRTARAVQSHVRSSARTRAARCSRPTARSTPSRTQPAAQPCCGTVKRTAVRAWARPARVSQIFLAICKDVSIRANINRCINIPCIYIYTCIPICIHM